MTGQLVKPTPQWYLAVPPLPWSKAHLNATKPDALSKLQARAEALHSTELSVYTSSTNANSLTSTSSDVSFLQRILTSGTLSDRLSALTLMVQSSPVHNTKALESLKSMSQKKGREESLKALRAIVDWWTGGGAPDRKLRYFREQPLTHPAVSDEHLIVWYFEDWLKKFFFGVLQILEALSLDPLLYVRTQAMSLILSLLRDKPEQEQNLLRLLVNKLGDSERQVASRASYHLLLLLQSHPQMKSVVVREISSLARRVVGPKSAARPKIKAGNTALTDNKNKQKNRDEDKTDLQRSHSQYYATITLNQITLTPNDREVAVQLINTYFDLFQEILGESTSLDQTSKVSDVASKESPVDGPRRKGGNDKQGRGKGKKKEKPGDAGFVETEDSQSKLVSAIMTGVNRAFPFAKLNVEDDRFMKRIDILFRITHTSTFNISIQALRFILQACISLPNFATTSTSKFTSITDRYYRTLYASLQDSRLTVSSKQAMYLNLLSKSLKIDKNTNRVSAFIRRFLQLLVSGANGGAEFVAGGLYLLGELFSSEPGLRSMLESRSTLSKRSSSDDHESNEGYDPRKRDPQYANAPSSPLWELMPLLHHFHPTIRLHTSQLVLAEPLTANADLSLNTLSHFLDRFVYKNPKKAKPRGTSVMQPAAAALDGTGVRVMKGSFTDIPNGTLNDERFWKKDVDEIPVDQVFFHRYFSQKGEQTKAKAAKVASRKNISAEQGDESREYVDSEEEVKFDDDDDDDDDDEDEDEKEIWKAMQASLPNFSDDDNDVEDDDVVEDDDESEGPGQVEDDDNDSESGDAEDNESNFSLMEGSDDDDLLVPDDDLLAPDDSRPMLFSHGSEEEEWTGVGVQSKKRRRGHNAMQSDKKKRLRALPTFATYEDYAQMIEGGPEDNV